MPPAPPEYTPASIAACNAAFIKSIRDSCLSTEDWEREYLCVPAKLAQLITSEDYDNCVLPAPWNLVPDKLDPATHYGDVYVGVDCGRSRNLTAAWAIQQGFNKQELTCYRSAAIRTIRDADFPRQHAELLPIVAHRSVTRGYIDQGTQGRALADSVAAIEGRHIQPFGMSAPRMAEMAELLRAFVQMRRVSLPADPKVKQSVLCVRRKLHPNGRTLSYGGEVDGDHGDCFWALALALYAAEGILRTPLMIGHEPEIEEVEVSAQ